jgi:hypothetical protein
MINQTPTRTKNNILTDTNKDQRRTLPLHCICERLNDEALPMSPESAANTLQNKTKQNKNQKITMSTMSKAK